MEQPNEKPAENSPKRSTKKAVKKAAKKTTKKTAKKTTKKTAKKTTKRTVKKTPAESLKQDVLAQQQSEMITDEMVRERAYLIWEGRGCTPGDPAADWLRAESELRAELL